MIMIVVVYAGAVVFCLLVSMHLAMGEGIHVPGQKTQMPPGMQPRRSRVE
jgi:NADH:ubiquinone oxidoreductase subunit 6 (subunit J)